MRVDSPGSSSEATASVVSASSPAEEHGHASEQLFYDLLCCPKCKGALDGGPGSPELSCPTCRFRFPVVDGIPVLFPCDVRSNMDRLFGRYWDSEEKALVYDTMVEGADEIFGTYNHESEVHALRCFYDAKNMGVVLDAGCGNGRFMDTLPATSLKVGLDASLNLLRHVKRRGRGDFLVCGELEHMPFQDGVMDTVISCRVIQHLHAQAQAVHEIGRVTRDQGDVILELYNTWNPKTIYKNIRMSQRWGPVFNAPFRLLFKSMSPFGPWGINYDRYNDWFQVKRWMKQAGLGDFQGRGAGFGYHKYLFIPFYINAVMTRHAPGLARAYYNACYAIERRVGSWIPVRYGLEKFTLCGRKGAVNRPSLPVRAWRRGVRAARTSSLANPRGRAELRRERSGADVVVRENEFHLRQAVDWLCRAQDATPDGGVSRAYSLTWHPGFRSQGWQPSYPETTGYIIPTLYDCAARLDDVSLRQRAARMADWEIEVQMNSGAVMGGTVDRPATPAVFNTGQVLLGWVRAHQETGNEAYLRAAGRAASYLLRVQSPDGSWRKGNSSFADPVATTYNSRVGWALMLYGQHADRGEFVEAGQRNMTYTLGRQTANGWFAGNCLSDPDAPLLHTICYAMEGLLGAYSISATEEYLAGTRRAADALIGRIRDDGGLAGRFDSGWRGTVPWSCLTGCAQLAGVLLGLWRQTGLDEYRSAARRLLEFLKRTQHCTAHDPGLRGGIMGSYPVDGDYGRFEVLNWATKFYVDALLLDGPVDESVPE